MSPCCRMMGLVVESLSTQVLDADIEVPCPACQYPIWALFAEVVAQTAVLCPCCRCRVWLRDADGSMQTAGDAIARQIDEVFKGLFE